ncbi:MAG: UDP-N-acetylmuramate--L-alanine ligase [Candidatus Pacebacteria bacterium]|nr:UDP-N-acetylmuramate--L-alanine ligase [Candidatus Paceibacterota bacterium]
MKYFLGIGGIGISALARFYLLKGEKVFGSDACDSAIIEKLREDGAEVSIGQRPENIPGDCDELIFTPAVKEDNPEMMEAKRRGMKMSSYPQALGELSKNYHTIAIAGTHGKSTTTAMLSLIMVEAGLDPTVIIGTKLKEFGGSNFRMGKSDYLVIEACEYERSFLNYHPQIAIVTNIEEDHLDYYENMDNLRRAFEEFASHVPDTGFVIEKKGVGLSSKVRKIEFSIDDPEVGEIRKIVSLPGEHNLLNALAAYKVAEALGVDKSVILSSLSKYIGSWRRFDVFELDDLILIDDYAHHPTEILATLKAAREKYADKKICCVYQPHQYQRTQFLFDDFINVFSSSLGVLIDKLILLDVYDVAGREGNEEIKKNYNSRILAERIADERCIHSEDDDLISKFDGYDVVIMMGAGNIYDISHEVKKSFGYDCDSCTNT